MIELIKRGVANMEIKRIFYENSVVYGADRYGCNKFKIMIDIPSNSYLLFCNEYENDVMIANDLDVDILKAKVEDLYLINIYLSDFINRWIQYFGGLDLKI
jgi:hypothetical protein